MGERRIGRRFSCGAEVGDGVGDVGGVPEDDRGDDEVEAGGTKLLRLGTAVGDPPLLEGADDLRERMTLLALVEAGVAAPGAIPGFRASRA
jgi:hypothetical protein